MSICHDDCAHYNQIMSENSQSSFVPFSLFAFVLLCLIALTLTLVSRGEATVTRDQIQFRGGIAYTANQERAFSGVILTGYEDGQVQETTIVNGLPNGLETWYDSSGLKKTERSYKNGIPDGVETWYSQNGQIKVERSFFDGMLTRSKSYENGQVRTTSKYFKCLLEERREKDANGRSTDFLLYTDGKMDSGREFHDGVQEDDFNPNLWLLFEEEIVEIYGVKRSVKSAEWTMEMELWNANEEKFATWSSPCRVDARPGKRLRIRGMNLVHHVGWAEVNRPEEEGSPWECKRCKRTFWDKNNQKRWEQNFIDGKANGTWTVWYENGLIRSVQNYKDGKAEGLWTLWEKDGQVVGKETYRAGERIE